MRFSRSVAAALMIAGAGSPGAAECYICDREVKLSGDHARCFLENFDAIAEAIRAEEEGYRLINLASCTPVLTGGSMWRGGLGQMARPDVQGDTRAAPAPKVKSAYILDLGTAECLRRLLAAQPGKLDPTVEVNIEEQCAP